MEAEGDAVEDAEVVRTRLGGSRLPILLGLERHGLVLYPCLAFGDAMHVRRWAGCWIHTTVLTCTEVLLCSFFVIAVDSGTQRVRSSVAARQTRQFPRLYLYSHFVFDFFSCYFGVPGRHSVNTEVYQSIKSCFRVCPRVKASCA